MLRLDLSLYKSLSSYDGPIVIVVDSSGVSVPIVVYLSRNLLTSEGLSILRERR